MRLAFLGTPDFAVAALAAIVEAGHEVACVYSQPPAPRGRGHELKPSPVHAFAEARGIPVRTPASMRDPAEIEAFAALGLDAAVVVAFGQILPAAVLEAPRLGSYNVHASLLPRWRGAAPIQRAILAGDAETGVGIMRMEAGLDTGPVLAEGRTAIGAKTAGDLTAELAQMGAGLMVYVLARMPGVAEVQQGEDGVTYAKKIDKAEARIDFSQTAEQVERQVRAFAPAPGAWFELGGERCKVLEAQVVDGAGEPGLVLDDKLTVACGAQAIRPLQVQRAGRPVMATADLLRGWAIPAGTRLA